MKRRNLLSTLLHPTTLPLCGLGTLLPGLLAAQAGPAPDDFVYETDTEFQTVADVDGDGHPDLVVADKATGQFRVAPGGSSGRILFRDHPGDSGLGGLTGFSAGPVLRDDRDTLVFADTSANRIQTVDTPTDSPLSEPLRIPLEVPGPIAVTAIDLPAGPDHDPDFHDLLYHSTLLAPDGDSNALQRLRNRGSGPPFDDLGAELEEGLPARPNRVFLDFNDDPFFAYRLGANGKTLFVVRDPDDPGFDPAFDLEGLPEDAAYAYADFDRDDRAEFLFYTPGSDRLLEAAFDGREIVPTAETKHPYAVADIRVILSDGQPELLVLSATDGTYERFAYDGAGRYLRRQSFPAPKDGGAYTGAVGIGKHLHLLVGDARGVTRSAVTHAFDGENYKEESTQDATTLKPAGRGASVLLFDAAPLTDADARLLGRFDAGPWTSAFRIESGNRATVESERYRNTAGGLGDPEPVAIDTTPPATEGGLVNQPFPDVSLRFTNAPVGEALPQLSLSPPAGHYDRAVRPELDRSEVGDVPRGTIYYRTAQDPNWTPLAGPAPVLLQDTRFEAFVDFGDGAFSNIVAAEYTFPDDPSDMDADGDGIPDFVERHYGLDPDARDDDADDDGVSDLEEILAGTDPTDDDDFPDRDTLDYERPNSFDLLAAPAVPDPADLSAADLRPYPETGGADRPARLRVHQPSGFYFGQAPTDDHPELSAPAARIEAIERADRDLFAVVSTERNFPVDDGAPRDYGRQLAALLPYPDVDFTPFDYQDFGDAGGFSDLAAEAKAWRGAARDYYESLERPLVALDPLDPEATLVLLLVETFLGERLHERGRIDRPNVSLTPFRESESPLDPEADGDAEPERDRALSTADLLSLQREAGGSNPYLLRDIIETVEASIDAPADSDVEALIELARTLYATAADDDSPGSLRQPFDALRRFLRQGDLDRTGYDQATSLLDDAQAGAATVLDAVAPREIRTVHLIRQGGESPACPVWAEVLFTSADTFDPDAPNLSGTDYALVDRRGEPFRFGRAFPLTEGSVFRIRGYLEDAPDCGGDFALEVIEAPELVYLRNAPPSDRDGDLIPDALAELNPGTDFDPFDDSDGDGYTDLQEILDGTNPADPASRPAEQVDLGPPQLEITPTGPNTAAIEFDFPREYARHVEFVLYGTDDLTEPFAPTGDTANHTGAGNHEQVVDQSDDAEFFIFRMQLK